MTEFLCGERTVLYLDGGGGYMNLPMWLNVIGLSVIGTQDIPTMRACKMVKPE